MDDLHEYATNVHGIDTSDAVLVLEGGIRKDGLYAPGKGTHAHDAFIAKAQQFIEKNKNNPFFLYIPFAIPHAELAVPSDCKHLAHYKSLNWHDPARAEGGGGGEAWHATWSAAFVNVAREFGLTFLVGTVCALFALALPARVVLRNPRSRPVPPRPA